MLFPLGDVAPEESTTVPSSFQSSAAPEMENNCKPERVQPNTDRGHRSPESASTADSSQIVGLDGADEYSLRPLPAPPANPSHSFTSLSKEKDDDEGKERASDKGLGGAPSNSHWATSSDPEGHAPWPAERYRYGDSTSNSANRYRLLPYNFTVGSAQNIKLPVERDTVVPTVNAPNMHPWAQPTRPIPLPFIRDPRLYLPGLAIPGSTPAQSTEQALRMIEPFKANGSLTWAPQTGYPTLATGGPGLVSASTLPHHGPFEDRHIGNAPSVDASRQSQAGPSRRGKESRKRESKAQTRMCTLATCEYFGHVFNCKKDLLRHVRHSRHHQGEEGSLPRTACPLCPKDCARPDSLDRHLRKVHGLSTASPS